jgi:hypothetical protein
MSRINWKFYSKRRKANIQTFLKGISTTKEAIDKFTRLKIVPPLDLILSHFGESDDELLIEKAAPQNVYVEDSVQKKESVDEDKDKGAYDDLVTLAAETSLDN